MGTQNFSLVPRSWQDEKNIFLYFFTELKIYHLSARIEPWQKKLSQYKVLPYEMKDIKSNCSRSASSDW